MRAYIAPDDGVNEGTVTVPENPRAQNTATSALKRGTPTPTPTPTPHLPAIAPAQSATNPDPNAYQPPPQSVSAPAPTAAQPGPITPPVPAPAAPTGDTQPPGGMSYMPSPITPPEGVAQWRRPSPNHPSPDGGDEQGVLPPEQPVWTPAPPMVNIAPEGDPEGDLWKEPDLDRGNPQGHPYAVQNAGVPLPEQPVWTPPSPMVNIAPQGDPQGSQGLPPIAPIYMGPQPSAARVHRALILVRPARHTPRGACLASQSWI